MASSKNLRLSQELCENLRNRAFLLVSAYIWVCLLIFKLLKIIKNGVYKKQSCFLFGPIPNPVLNRANPHLTLRVRQATSHVTSRRSTHPRFTSLSPTITRANQPSCAHSIASPLLTRSAWVCWCWVARLPRVSTLGEKDSGEPERAPEGP